MMSLSDLNGTVPLQWRSILDFGHVVSLGSDLAKLCLERYIVLHAQKAQMRANPLILISHTYDSFKIAVKRLTDIGDPSHGLRLGTWTSASFINDEGSWYPLAAVADDVRTIHQGISQVTEPQSVLRRQFQGLNTDYTCSIHHISWRVLSKSKRCLSYQYLLSLTPKCSV
ncbi:hypothetical protein BDR03DRAFT_948252 [Suillus americanus]|nr:hypothetical protein BDR03DRAFT_948252 [Suillus americanus]